MIENNNQPVLDNSNYSHFVGVRFQNGAKAYFFGIKDMEVTLDQAVVVETMRGVELGYIAIEAMPISSYASPLGLKPVLRIASDVDIKINEKNIADAKYAMEICRSEVERLQLQMSLISCEFTLDKTKVIFSYVADERVDFRELLKVLASRLHTRIELRQIGSRDKAKMIGGIGMCGLPLCCSTFLNEFDGISIARAKNQMLAINIPKLSGHCGKLICCLKFEDDAYSDARKHFPDLGTKVKIEDAEYTLTNINIISGVLKLENPEDIKFITMEEYQKLTKPFKPNKPQFNQNNNFNQDGNSSPRKFDGEGNNNRQNNNKHHFNNHEKK